MINFRLMRNLWLFIAVAEEQNFSRAAKRLGMSQPPLTEHIQVLEQSLKVKLFERSRQGARLTPVGQAILPAVRRFVTQMEQLEFAVSEATSGKLGTLTIGAVSSSMFEVVLPLITMLRNAIPDISVSMREIDSAEAVPALQAGQIDIAFARLQGDLGVDIISKSLSQDRLAVALPAQHALADARSIRLKQIANEPLIMFSREISPIYFDSIVSGCQKHGFSPRFLHYVRSIASQITMVGFGQGLALVPSGCKDQAPPGVVIRRLSEKVELVTTAAAWSRSSKNPVLSLAISTWGW